MDNKKIFISKFLVLFAFVLFGLVIIYTNTNGIKKFPNNLNKMLIGKISKTYNINNAIRNEGPIQLSMQMNNNYYYHDAENDEIYLYLDLEADKIDVERERSPLNIALVIDKSGSMSDYNKLDYVKESVNYMIDELDMHDYVSLVTYNDTLMYCTVLLMLEEKVI